MLPRRSWDIKLSFNHVAFVHQIVSIVSPHNQLLVAEMEENKSSKCSPEPCDDVNLSAKGELSEKSTTDREEESLEKSKKGVKRTWREGSEEDQFRGLLKEREDILAIPVTERSKQLMNRYRDVCEKIRRWKYRFPNIKSKRLTTAVLNKKANDKARLSTAEAKAKTKEDGLGG